MNTQYRQIVSILLAALIAAVVTYFATLSWHQGMASSTPPGADTSGEPLYWVAPMDPNYRRDKPGKSPMGMDLVPVYADATPDGASRAGTVVIASEVVNNLGVRTAKVERRPLQSTIRTVGYVQYGEDRLIHIHPRVQGWVEKLYVKAAGDPVVKGEALYELYSPELVNAQKEYLLALNRKNQPLVSAAGARLKALQLSDAQIERLARSREVSQTTTFYAPQAGVVDNLNIREGFYVQPGTTLMSIGSIEDVWVEAEVFERQSVLVDTGMPVTMTLDYLPGRVWQGEIDYIYPSLDEQTRTLRVRLRFSNADGLLKPNMFAQVQIHVSGATERLVVPRESVIRTGNQNRVVLALGEGKFRSVVVELGLGDEQRIEVIRGLAEGDTVVSSAQFLLDSESSKTADLSRIEGSGGQVQSASAKGVVNNIDMPGKVVNISRGPIEKWNRPPATMDFRVSEDIELADMQVGERIEFTFEIHGDDFVIVAASSVRGLSHD